MSLRFSVSLSFPVLSRPLFYFCFEALFNFCREIFPPRNDYCSPEIAEMDEENRIRLRTFLPSDDIGMQHTEHVELCAKTFGKKSHLRQMIIDIFPEGWIIHLRIRKKQKNKIRIKTCEFGELRNVGYTWAIIAAPDIQRTVMGNC